ncbi:MAG: biotin--[acetyl-CoA-carboxylase] ligase [Phycisphaerae bacterium]|nr:biotin--[acetyl-CoA-carboxylase] ligase [Phycisphaerae bacterium]
MPAHQPHSGAPLASPRLDLHDSLDSTSLHARRLVESDAKSLDGGPLLIVARSQTAGIGRLGRTWASPVGGLWCTLVARLDRPPHPALGVRAGLAVLAATREALGRQADRFRLKWPNDLMLDDRKFGGVLVEVVTPPRSAADGPPGRAALIGVGLNANADPATLPEDVRSTAATLRAVGLPPIDLDALTRAVAARLAEALTVDVLTGPDLHEANRSLWGVGRDAEWAVAGGSRIRGVLQGLDDHGRAVIRDAHGRQSAVSSAEWSA